MIVENRFLNGWKEIAQFIGRGVRTVQRWEVELGLPVHRPAGGSRTAVVAMTEEIDAWMARTATKPGDPAARCMPTLPVIVTVDDNEAHRYALSVTLAKAGYGVSEAESAATALALLKSIHVDLVLLDIHLPDMNGFDLCHAIKSNPEIGSVPVLFHTAIDDSESARRRAKQLGAAGFLAYPVEREDLLNAVSACIATGRYESRVPASS